MEPTFLGFGGPTPLAIIIWSENGESKYKTVCYDESEVIFMYNRHQNSGDFYSKLTPTIHYMAKNEVQEVV